MFYLFAGMIYYPRGGAVDFVYKSEHLGAVTALPIDEIACPFDPDRTPDWAYIADENMRIVMVWCKARQHVVWHKDKTHEWVEDRPAGWYPLEETEENERP